MEEIYRSPALADSLCDAATELYVLNKHRANALNTHNEDARNRSFLSAVLEYCRAVRHLAEITQGACAAGLRKLHDYAVKLSEKTENGVFKKAMSLSRRADELFSISLRFDFINQTVKTESRESGALSCRISALAEEILGEKLNFTFSAVNNVRLSPLEEALISSMKLRAPKLFEELDDFYKENKRLDFYSVIDLRSEILFYTGYLKFIKEYEKAGFSFSFAKTAGGALCFDGIYDVALAIKMKNADAVVTNGAELKKGDIFIVSGSNQGGKTTFLRAFGQCAFLAALGLPVPAARYEAPFFDTIATHFNHAEKAGKSRLEEEIGRVKTILSVASGRSLLLFNECFVGTRRGDAVLLSEKIFARLFELGATCGFVTHFFELPLRDERLVSFVAEVSGDDSERRTYRISRRRPDGLAHAHSIAVRCGATYEQLLAETK
ncbi:MAG: hypothetical protein IJW21_03685 [Clostridia bacterium]|nr:hypothetical protein [Clostridia bacterium]